MPCSPDFRLLTAAASNWRWLRRLRIFMPDAITRKRRDLWRFPSNNARQVDRDRRPCGTLLTCGSICLRRWPPALFLNPGRQNREPGPAAGQKRRLHPCPSRKHRPRLNSPLHRLCRLPHQPHRYRRLTHCLCLRNRPLLQHLPLRHLRPRLPQPPRHKMALKVARDPCPSLRPHRKRVTNNKNSLKWKIGLSKNFFYPRITEHE